MTPLSPRKRPSASGFTLIELLIVVAIIAILAAIAVPNFLEAQTRAKVSRTLNDFRTIKTGLESYAVDYNDYPEVDLGPALAPTVFSEGRGLLRLTTPISYLTSVPQSPFEEENIGFPGSNPKFANELDIYLYVRGIQINSSETYDPNYLLDRAVYLFGISTVSPAAVPLLSQGFYFIKSVGPNNIDDRDGNQVATPGNARIYDPTNGTISDGDIVTFSDTEILASQRSG